MNQSKLDKASYVIPWSLKVLAKPDAHFGRKLWGASTLVIDESERERDRVSALAS